MFRGHKNRYNMNYIKVPFTQKSEISSVVAVKERHQSLRNPKDDYANLL
jgi:hypothetical protein